MFARILLKMQSSPHVPQCILLPDQLYFYLSKSKYLRERTGSRKFGAEQVGKSGVQRISDCPWQDRLEKVYLLRSCAQGGLCLRQSIENVFLASPYHLPPFFHCPDLLSLLQPPPACQDLPKPFFSPPVEFPRPILQHIQEIVCL